MKLIGVLGGISPHSTSYYYGLLNALARQRLGGRHSARVLIHSVDFAEVEAMQVAKDWRGVTRELIAAATSLEQGGAACVVLACNTMHHVADKLAAAITIPLLHIGDAVAKSAAEAKRTKVGLLGTQFTMASAFLRERLEARGVEVVVPPGATRGSLHRIIFGKLCDGDLDASSRAVFIEAIHALVRDEGIDGVVLGCTEIGILLGEAPLPVPSFDTAKTHVAAAMDFALAP